jgi:hypothetical protein
MNLHLDKLGTGGTILSSLVAAPACCMPLIASVAGALGFGALGAYHIAFEHLLQAFVLLAVVGAALGYGYHHQPVPLVATVLSAAGVLSAFNVLESQWLLILSLGGLVSAAIGNSQESRRCAACATSATGVDDAPRARS